ncbi:FtsX-like permease family protein [Amycolatopsis thailandensis]|uniref:FtsX-like permease family protein n=1 Tax=Amycolatopsis thailandensis TaxID=589330 RepID=UPI00363AFCC1
MLTLAWQTIRTRLGGFAGAFIAILLGTALVTACGILMESGLRAGVPTQRYADATVVVGGVQSVRPPGADALAAVQITEQSSVPTDITGKLSTLPGVEVAVAEQSFPAHVVTGAGQVLTGPDGRESLGHNWDAAILAPFALTSGQAPVSGDEVVLDAEVASRAGATVGSQVLIAVRSTPLTFRVSGIAATSTPDSLSRQSALFFSSARAEELAGRPGNAHAIGVLAEPGVSAETLAETVRTALAGQPVEVAAGSDRGDVEFLDVSQTRTLLLAIAGSFGGFALLIAVFVVAGTLALTINQRRREFALLRAVAATPQQIRLLIGIETLIVALVAGVLGSLLGLVVAFGLRDAFAAIGVIPADFALALGPLPLVAAVLLGLLTAGLAAWTASRRPASIRPVEALTEAAIERKELGLMRLYIGWGLVLASLAGATAPLFLRGETALVVSSTSTLVAVIGLALVGPQVVGWMVRVIAPVLARISNISGYLAAANSKTNLRRLAAAVTPVTLAIAFALSIVYSQTSSVAAAQEQAAGVVTADYEVVSAVGGVSPEVAGIVRRVPGVAVATPQVRTQAIIVGGGVGGASEPRAVGATGLDPAQIDGNLDLGLDAGRIAELTGDTVALSRDLANGLDKKVGDEVPLYFGDGISAKLRLVATYKNDLAIGDVVLAAELARAHTGDLLDDSVLIRRVPGTDPAAVEAALQEVLTAYPGLSVASSAKAAAAGGQDTQFYLNLVTVGVIVGYVAISVANTLVMSTAQRAREFALLRLVGATRQQVVRMMRLEALVTSGIAVAIGTLAPAIPLVLLNLALRGTPLPAGPPWYYLGIIGGAILLGFVSLGIATRTALRTRPIDAIGIRE